MWLSNIELIVTNLLVIYLAYTQNWSTQEILLLYWLQSVIIGIFQFIKILDLKKFSTEGFKINDQSVLPTIKTKYSTAIFFAFHFGFFHFVYLIFILTFNSRITQNVSFRYTIQNGTYSYSSSGTSLTPISNFSTLIYPTLIFFVNHLVSFFSNRRIDRQSNKNIGAMMFAPYARIIPMHLTLIFGFALGIPKLFFLVIRGFVDFISHLLEHYRPIPEQNNNI